MAEVRPAREAAASWDGRGRVWLVWLVASGLLIGAGYGLAQVTDSTWADALDNAAAQPIATAAVETMTFAEERVAVGGRIALGVVLPLGGAPPPEGQYAVVTAELVSVEDPLQSGAVVAEVSGRPVLTLDLAFPLYRDLARGASGPDVAAVQSALAGLGLYAGAVDGVYGTATSAAVDALYRRAGYAAPRDEAADAAVEDAEAAVGVVLARREVVAIPRGGAVVVRVASIGAVVDEEAGAISVRTGLPTAVARATAAGIEEFAIGSRVSVTRVGSDEPISGVVTAIREFSSDTSTGPAGYDVVVTLEEPGDLVDGEPVVVEPGSELTTTRGLAVPLTAVREDGDGHYVLILPAGSERPDARAVVLERVSVVPQQQQDGSVRVTAEGLTAGMLVAVGDVPWSPS